MGRIELISESTGGLGVIGALGLASLVAMFGFTEPTMYDVTTPVNFIGYWHIALAWTSAIALLVTFGASAQYLRTRTRFWNLLGHSAGEVGFLFLTGTLIMGSIWGSEMWGTYWSWGDVRLVTLLITWFVYLGYLVVFASTKDSEGRYAAVYGVLGFVTIPLSYFSTRLWSPAFHDPTIGGTTGETIIDPVTLLVSILAIMTLFAFLCSVRLRLHRARDEILQKTGQH